MTYYVLRAALSSAQHPEYGQITVPFPISNDDYEVVMERLEELGMGDVLAQDCRIDSLDSGCPVLQRLEGTLVNVDELDLLSRQLDNCDEREIAQFQGMAEKRKLSNIVDLINLTFSGQHAAVITDFSDPEEVGRALRRALKGCCPPAEECRETLELLLSGQGVFTPYGLVCDSGAEEKPLYDGWHFPAYLYDQPLLVLERGSTRLTLPMPEQRLDRLRVRGELDGGAMEIVMNGLPPRLAGLLAPEQAQLSLLNLFCQQFRQIEEEGLTETFCAALLAEGAGTLSEAVAVAMDMEDYELVPAEAAEYGRQVLRRLGADEEIIDTIDGYMDFVRLGEDCMMEDGVRRTEFGPVRRLSRPFPSGPEMGQELL